MQKEKYMQIALGEAKKAFKKGEVPVGAVIVKDDKIIAKAYNKVEKRRLCLEHAELIAIRKASKKLKNWRLIGCDIYVTLEPCEMCKKAIEFSRIENIYYSTPQKRKEYKSTPMFLINSYNKPAKQILSTFFKKIR